MSPSNLSPFEFKDLLLEKAAEYTKTTKRPIENAARGNPDFLATIPRHAMLSLGKFALEESERSYTYMSNLFGGEPLKKGIVNRWDCYAMINKDEDGVKFLKASLSYCESNFGIEKDDLLYEFVLSYLGCSYPVPPRMLKYLEKIVMTYLREEMGCDTQEFDVFATEGGTAAMTDLFQTMKINGLVEPNKDKIAMITPIFTPYLEIPHLPMYNNEIVDIKLDRDNGWQLTEKEVEKLKDPAVKILCVVNPSNPPSVALNEKSLNMIADIVENHNPNLMIVTDDVYATFSKNFKSLFAICPYNTVLVYSFSKYFGATGWRIGTISTHKENIFDALISKLPENHKLRLDKHYHGLTQDIRGLKFINRLVADSRAVALNHTAGLSLPQQLQMTLFALASLMDYSNVYKKEAKTLIKRRYDLLYNSLGLTTKFKDIENNVGYYTLIDLGEIAEAKYGKELKEYLLKKYSIEEFLLDLAESTGIVLMPGDGFAAIEPLTARVSLANLKESNYEVIGKLLNESFETIYNKHIKK